MSAQDTPVLRLQQLSKSFGENRVLWDIDLAVSTGEIVVIMGPSGGGKSTLLRCVNFLETPTSGEVWLHGELLGSRDIRRKRARIGMVFQRFNLFAHLSALDNVAFGPRKVLGMDRPQAQQLARELLARVHLNEHEQKYPYQLSGGQQQRVAIARALAMSPALLLLDEPTSALDPELVGEVLAVIREIAQSGMTMIIATHEMTFAREVAHRVIFMEAGRFVEENPPDIMFSRPREERTQQFLSRILREDVSLGAR